MYKDKKVFITGHTGIKGSWLTAMLIEMGAEVKGYSHDTRFHYDLLGVKHESVIDDILDIDRLYKEIYNFNPDIIFHLAAQALVSVGYNRPRDTFESNAIGTLNLLEVCRLGSFSNPIVCVTTDKVYRDTDRHVGYKEADILWGSDPYSASKVCAEQIIDTYRKFYLKNLSSVRAGNVICGGEDSKDRILTDIVNAYRDSTTLILRRPNAVRPFQHALDCVYGYLHLGYKMFSSEKFAGSWNFGSSEGISVLDFVHECNKYMSVNYEVRESDMKENNLLYLDTAKTNVLLDYAPLYDINRTVKSTCEWYIEYFKNNNVITFNQINSYLLERKI